MAGSKRTIDGVIARALANLAASAGPASVYAVVDAARDPRIPPALAELGPRACCLYGAEVPRELARVSPHLVPLPPTASFSRLFASAGRGHAWGVMLRSAAPVTELALHLGGLIRAALPDARTVLFRFYDPRVLRRFLPTCDEQELATLFGPVEAFLLEQPDGEHREYRREHGALVVRQPRWELWLE